MNNLRKNSNNSQNASPYKTDLNKKGKVSNESSSSSSFVVAKEKNNENKVKIGQAKNGSEKNLHVIQSENEAEKANNQNKDLDYKNENINENVTDLENDNINLKDDIQASCMNIFCNFAKFNNEEKDFFISYQNLCKILRTVCILDTKLNSKTYLKMANIDVLLKKVNPNGKKLNGKQFMNFIVLISNKLDAENFAINPQLCVVKVIKTFFEPFSNFIENKSNQNEVENQEKFFYHKQIENKIISLRFDTEVLNVLNSVYSGIKYIYITYFYYEVNKFQDPDKIVHGSFNSLNEFCKNFEISPFIITTDRLAIFFNLIFDLDSTELLKDAGTDAIFAKDIGSFFTLSKFAIFLVHMALLCFERFSKSIIGENEKDVKKREQILKSTNLNNLCTAEKLVFFLERLESSKGIEFMEKKTNKPCTAKMSLIPPKEILTNLNSYLINNFSNFDKEYSFNSSSKKIKPEEKEINSHSLSQDYRSILSIKSDEVIEKFNNNIETFREIFDLYAQIGDKFCSLMSLSGFTKFLKDCNLVYQPIAKFNFNKSVLSSMKSYSKSPIRSDLPYQGSSSSQNIHKNRFSRYNSAMSSIALGKLVESDISIIYSNLTGNKNFPNSEKIKNQFDRNKGYTPNFEECISSPRFGHLNSRKVSIENVLPTKLNFNLFLKSFELLATKLHPEMEFEEAVCFFIEHDIVDLKENPDINSKKNILEALAYIRREEYLDILKDLNNVLLPHYMNYCNKFGLIIFDNFFQFYKDFGIFPEIVNLVQLKTIFFILADFLKNQIDLDSNQLNQRTIKSNSRLELKSIHTFDSANTKVKSEIKKNVALNFDLFLDSLALSSLHSKIHDESSELEKIIFLAERMCQSQGVMKSQIKSGQTFSANKEFHMAIASIKAKMPNFYNKRKDFQSVLRSPACFDQLFDIEN